MRVLCDVHYHILLYYCTYTFFLEQTSNFQADQKKKKKRKGGIMISSALFTSYHYPLDEYETKYSNTDHVLVFSLEN